MVISRETQEPPQDDAAGRADDMHPQLQQPVAQPRHLGLANRSVWFGWS